MRTLQFNPTIKRLARSTALAASLTTALAHAEDWPSWRGPNQNGTSSERGLPEQISLTAPTLAWSQPIASRGTPVIFDGRVYTLGYEGAGPDLQEILLCLDEKTGEKIWDRRANDFISDIVYNRYAICSPTVDPETGNVYWTTHAGLFSCFDRDGKLLWQHSMMEEFGRTTYPNGRTVAPAIDGDLVIVHGMTSSWGKHGPTRNRFHAFDKRTGDLVWTATPEGGPKDNPFSLPVFEWRDGQRLLYAGTAEGCVACVNAKTGDVVWKMPITVGGVCASTLLYRDTLIAVHGTENLDSSDSGRMLAIRLGATPEAGKPGPVILGADHEAWRNGVESFSSSPVLVGNRVYVTNMTGELLSVDADTGRILWSQKLAATQIHASPAAGEGRLYVPMANGLFYVIEPTDAGPKELSKVQLQGECLGAPAIANGCVYIHTTEKLYCFRGPGALQATKTIRAAEIEPARGEASRLLIVPAEVNLVPGQTQPFTARLVDKHGLVVQAQQSGITWNLNPKLPVSAGPNGELIVSSSAKGGAAEVEGECNGLKATVRLRITPRLEFTEDFESTALTQTREGSDYNAFSFPPGQWFAARVQWEVVEKDGGKVLAQTLDNPLFQRTQSLIGNPDSRNYTMQVDIMSDGNRRLMSSAGVINQRYLIMLKGNYQEIEISSNMERIKESAPFKCRPNVWYRLKTRVDAQPDGSNIIRAKAWERDQPEPDEWTIEVRHENGHTHGAPGIYGFVPQSRFRVYLDNITVTAND
ncbi:MAG: PQQ-binding-like beta-propeller repeat protein [Phycisphaerales bacterium]|nr:PQQ-binding-like beta-propeller repeat protein [Phycisphaerales bacterium]